MTPDIDQLLHEQAVADIGKAFTTASGFAWRPVFTGLVGSLSHGTHNPDPEGIDDINVFSVVVPPLSRIVGLDVWEHWQSFVGRYDVTSFSLRKYIGLLLNGNPNVLCTLFLEPWAFRASREMLFLMENRHRFVSQRAFRAFTGYAENQLARMERGEYNGYMGTKRKALFDQFGYDPKMAAHTIRLWTMAIEFADTGELQVYRTTDHDMLMQVKQGAWPRDSVLHVQRELKAKAQVVMATSSLPEQPDREWAEDFLVTTTRTYLTHG